MTFRAKGKPASKESLGYGMIAKGLPHFTGSGSYVKPDEFEPGFNQKAKSSSAYFPGLRGRLCCTLGCKSLCVTNL